MTDTPVRLLKHPGPVARERWDSMAGRSTAFRVALRPGLSLEAALTEVFSDLGVVSAAVNLFGGSFRTVSYCLAAPRPGATQVASYTDPSIIEGPVSLVAANATLGLTEDGAPLVHCHALFAKDDGLLFGGHVVPDGSIVGTQSPIAFVRVLEGLSVCRRYDPETDMAVFHPSDEVPATSLAFQAGMTVEAHRVVA